MVQKPTPKTKHKNGISRTPKSTIPFSWVSRGPPCYRFATGWVGEKNFSKLDFPLVLLASLLALPWNSKLA